MKASKKGNDVPVVLALAEPLPLARHPAAVYLSQLAVSSRRTMTHNLNWVANLLSNGQCDHLTLDWAKLRYEHTAALRSVLAETHPPATANLKLTAVKQVLKCARKLKLITIDDYEDAVSVPPLTGNTPPRGRLLQPEEIEALIRVCVESKTPSGMRDAAAIACLCAGLRRSEVVALNLKDYNASTGCLLVVEGKGKKTRQAYLPPGGTKLIEDWLAVRGRKAGPLLYRCEWWGEIKPERITADALALRLIERGKSAGLGTFSAHDFRRTFISNLLDKGADMVTVQKLAGHADPATTAKYDRRGEDVKRKAVELLDGFGLKPELE